MWKKLYFYQIFNKSLQTQHGFTLTGFPTPYVSKCWKVAMVVPVPKANSPKTLNNLRPIPLTYIVIKT